MSDVYRTAAIMPLEDEPKRKPRWRIVEKEGGYSSERFRVQRRGFLGIWWKKAHAGSIGDARVKVQTLMEREKRGALDVVWTDLDPEDQ